MIQGLDLAILGFSYLTAIGRGRERVITYLSAIAYVRRKESVREY